MIKVNLQGRLGNQMFQYAILRLISKINDYEFSFSKNWLGKDLFDIDYGLSNNKNIPFKYINKKINDYDPKLFNISDNSLLNGFFQSEKYFEGYEEFIKSLFKIKDKNIDYSIINSNTCLIHFRGGDYKRFNYIPSKNWYDNAKKYILDNYNIDEFVVITDDKKLAKNYFNNDTIIKNDMNTDFCLLNNSHTNIISASTFSWWAVWLNENHNTIAPNKWLNHNNNISKKDIFYPYDIKTKKIIYL